MQYFVIYLPTIIFNLALIILVGLVVIIASQPLALLALVWLKVPEIVVESGTPEYLEEENLNEKYENTGFGFLDEPKSK